MTAARLALAALLSLTLVGGASALPMKPAAAPAGEQETAQDAHPAHGELMAFLMEGVDDPDALRGTRVAILASDGVDGFNLEVPRRYLSERGASVEVIVARNADRPARERTLTTANPSGEAMTVSFDRFLDEADPLAYHVIYVPGHRGAPADVAGAAGRAFIAQAVHAGRPVFANGNAPLLLLEAGLLEHRRATGDATIFLRLALSNAAAADAPLVNDGSIYTSRDAFDLPVMMRQLIDELRKRAPN
jgi:protease I